MQTRFSPSQLGDPQIAASEKILRNCVHCGFCIATCPTYVLLGDELDSPRGRIYLIKEMLEGGKSGEQTCRHACRSLPVMPVMHDDMPVECELHAPCRSRPLAYRKNLSTALARSHAALAARPDSAQPRFVSPGTDRGKPGAPVLSGVATRFEIDCRIGAEIDCPRQPPTATSPCIRLVARAKSAWRC